MAPSFSTSLKSSRAGFQFDALRQAASQSSAQSQHQPTFPTSPAHQHVLEAAILEALAVVTGQYVLKSLRAQKISLHF